MLAIIGVLCLLQAIQTPAQLITLRDGKIGVNFAGYHADAGLGGLLTGNSAHGGLSASAGTPWGARSAAGIGGELNGRPAGLAYAGAQASPDVGASAVLSGSAGERGYIGAEAHNHGKVSSVSKTQQHEQQFVTSAPPPLVNAEPSYVQKIKPPKKYSLIRPDFDHSAVQISESAARTAAIVPAPTPAIISAEVENTMPVLIVKQKQRQRLRGKRPRQHLRTVYVTKQKAVEEVEVAPQPQSTLQLDEIAEQPPRSDSKSVHTRKFTKSVQPVHSVHSGGFAAQADGNPVGLALQIPIGILQSLQQTLGGLANQQQSQPRQQG